MAGPWYGKQVASAVSITLSSVLLILSCITVGKIRYYDLENILDQTRGLLHARLVFSHKATLHTYTKGFILEMSVDVVRFTIIVIIQLLSFRAPRHPTSATVERAGFLFCFFVLSVCLFNFSTNV